MQVTVEEVNSTRRKLAIEVPLEAVMADPDNRGGVAILVAVKSDPSRSVRVNITLPQELLVQIDRYAQQHGLTRSRFLAQAAKGVLEGAR